MYRRTFKNNPQAITVTILISRGAYDNMPKVITDPLLNKAQVSTAFFAYPMSYFIKRIPSQSSCLRSVRQNVYISMRKLFWIIRHTKTSGRTLKELQTVDEQTNSFPKMMSFCRQARAAAGLFSAMLVSTRSHASESVRYVFI